MKILMTAIALLTCGFLFSQFDAEKRLYTPAETYIDRYEIDYELLNYTFINGDSSILLLLNLESAEEFRKSTSNVIYHDTINNVDILLYMKEEKSLLDN